MNQRILGLFGFALCLAFQNCSPVAFSKPAASQVVVAGTPPPAPSATPPPIQQALADCQDPNASMHVIDEPIFFDNPLNEVGATPVCAWGVGGNATVKNGFLTARYEQLHQVQLPANAILCDMSFQFQTQAMKYDDHFFFLVNDVVVAASDSWWQDNYLNSSSLQIDASHSLTANIYNWSRLVGQPNNNMVVPKQPDGVSYCLGENEGLSQCSWPQTEVSGQISMSVAPKIVTALGLKSSNSNVTLKFITTGDDDVAKDCQHEPLSLSVHLRYVQK